MDPENFDIDNFTNVIIPLILSYRNDYYIKGGRAFDIYFKDNQPSIDWDIVGSEEFIKYLKESLTDIANKAGITLLENITRNPTTDEPMIQLGFEGYEMEPNDPYILDVVISDNIHGDKITILQYMPFTDFVADLIYTLDKRADQTEEYLASLGDEGVLKKEAGNFNEKYGTNFDITKSFDENKQEIIEFLKVYIFHHFEDKNTRKIIMEKIVIPLKSLDNPTFDEINKIISTDLSRNFEGYDEEDIDSIENFEEFLTQDFNDILGGIFSLDTNKKESMKISLKFNKTFRRYNTIVNMTWDNLTDEYKIWIMRNCSTEAKGYLTLFNIDPLCKATLSCPQMKVYKNTTGCINKDIHNKIENLKRYM